MFTKNFYTALYGHISNKGGLELIDRKGVAKKITNTIYYTNFIEPGDTNNTYYARLDKFVTESKTSGNYMSGVAFGDGNAAPTLDDYVMSGNHMTNYSASAVINKEQDDEGVVISCIYTITNGSDAAFTISEIGLYGVSPNDGCAALVERTVLDSPVTIPAGGVGQVTYTIRMNYPV